MRTSRNSGYVPSASYSSVCTVASGKARTQGEDDALGAAALGQVVVGDRDARPAHGRSQCPSESSRAATAPGGDRPRGEVLPQRSRMRPRELLGGQGRDGAA